MVRKHIIRNRDNHIKEIRHIGNDDEYIMMEVFGTEHKDTLLFTPKNNNLQHSNTELKDRLGVPSYISKDINPMVLNVNLNLNTGLYLIEIVYEQSSILHKVNNVPEGNKGQYDSSADLLGSYKITSKKQSQESNVKPVTDVDSFMPDSVKKQMKNVTEQMKKINNQNTVEFVTDEKSIKFDGENNVNKRTIIEEELTTGEYNLQLKIPSNCYFKGMIIRKVVRYWGTNTEEVGTNVHIKRINVPDSEMCKPREAKITLKYDTDFELITNPNGFCIGYGDECNIFVKNSENKISQIFGGYVENVNKTEDTFEIDCKDRLRDTEKKYIMEHLTIQGGTKPDLEHRDIKNFKKYGELLKFLCDICEVTLKNNIPFDYWLLGEKHHEGHTITYGKKKDVKKIPVTNCMVSVRDNGVVLRNNSDGLKEQVFNLYSPKKPISLEGVNGANMHVTIGMGNPKTSQEIKDTVDVSVGDQIAGAIKWTKCGVSSNKKYVMGIGRRSAGKTSRRYSTGYWRSVFENKCPNCKAEGKLRWDSGRKDTKCIYNHGRHGSKRTWRTGIPETEITCEACDSDFDAVGGWEKMPGSKKRLKSINMGLKSNKHEQDHHP